MNNFFTTRGPSTHRPFHANQALHRAVSAQRLFDAEQLLHREAFTHTHMFDTETFYTCPKLQEIAVKIASMLSSWAGPKIYMLVCKNARNNCIYIVFVAKSAFLSVKMPETCQKNNESMFSSRPLGARPKSAYFTISWCGKCAEMCLIFHHGIVAGGCSKHHGALK